MLHPEHARVKVTLHEVMSDSRGVNSAVYIRLGRVGHPGQTNNLMPPKPKFFRLFRPRTGLANISKGGCPNWG